MYFTNLYLKLDLLELKVNQPPNNYHNGVKFLKIF